MPATISYRDMEAVVTPPNGYLEPFPLTLGPTQQPNDVRILFVSGSESASGGVSEAIQLNPDPPTGYTGAYTLDPGFETRGVYYRRIASGDTDTSVAWIKPTGWRDFLWVPITARGVDPAVAPVAGDLTANLSHSVGSTTLTVSSVTVPAAGEMIFCLWTVADPEGTWPSWPGSLGVPTGWNPLVATDQSGATFYATGTNPSVVVIGKKFAASGSTGSISVPIADGSHAFGGMYVFLRPAPDSTSVAGAVTTATTVGASSSSSTTNPVSVAGPVTTRSTVGQAFNGLTGYRISDPLYLTGTAVTGSVIRWNVTPGSAGSTYLVETSINNGASWDVATNNAQVPRLRSGDTTTLTVLTRVTMTRLSSSDTSPKMTSLELQVSCDASVDEYVPIGHGVIISVKPSIGTGSSSSGGGNGVFSSGGGQTGSGLFLKVKCVDPSRSISKNPWQKPFTLNTEPYDQAAVAMVTNRLPTQEDFSVVSANRTTDLLIYGLSQSDAWQDIRDLATACGFEAFFDVAGTFTFRQVRDPRITPPVWTFTDDATCTVTQIDRELTDDQTLNYIVVKGESTSSQNPVSAFAYDNDPSSPTYVGGRFGAHGAVITIPSVTTAEQAQTAANAILYASIGSCETTTITTVPIPFLECGDCVTVSIGDVESDGRYVINQITTSWPGQTITCFRQSSQE
jgi:hypothetical protein